MNRRKPVLLGVLTAVVWLLFPLLFGIIGYATFVVPASVEHWKAQGIRELPAGLQLMVDLSDLCKARWFIVFPLLLMLAIGATRLLAAQRGRDL